MLTGLKILVVDDDQDSRDLLIVALGSEGAEVAAVGSAAEAIAMLNQAIPDVLISDIRMPGEDGYSLIRAIRTLELFQDCGLPAIALTAFAHPDDRRAALDAGFQQHLCKPVNLDELVLVIAQLAGRENLPSDVGSSES